MPRKGALQGIEGVLYCYFIGKTGLNTLKIPFLKMPSPKSRLKHKKVISFLGLKKGFFGVHIIIIL